LRNRTDVQSSADGASDSGHMTSKKPTQLAALRRTVGRFALSGGALLVALLAVEVCVRALGISAPQRALSVGRDRTPSPDPILRFVNLPGGGRTLTYLSHADGAVFTATHNINALGLRGPETTRAKPPGVKRILCLGDSFTFGFGVDDHETMPAALQRAVEGLEPPYEVLNGGVPAYDTEQEVRLLLTRGLSFEPDLVLLVWYLNDVSKRSGPTGELTDRPPASVRWTAPNQEGVLPTLREWSRALDILCSRIYRAGYREYKPAATAQLYDAARPGWRRSQQALLRAQRLCRENGIEFAMVLYPELARGGEYLASHEPYQAVSAFCRENGIPCLDLEPAFLNQDMVSLRVHATDAHPNGRGHAIAGERVASWLLESGLLPERDLTRR